MKRAGDKAAHRERVAPRAASGTASTMRAQGALEAKGVGKIGRESGKHATMQIIQSIRFRDQLLSDHSLLTFC